MSPHLPQRLTFWGILILVVPDDQQFGQTRDFGDLRDDAEEALHPVVGQNHSRETLRLRRDQWQEERVAHAAPFLRRKTRK